MKRTSSKFVPLQLSVQADESAHITAVFNAASSGDGTVAEEEFVKMLPQLDFAVEAGVARDFFHTMDEKKKGRVALKEFLEWVPSLRSFGKGLTPPQQHLQVQGQTDDAAGAGGQFRANPFTTPHDRRSVQPVDRVSKINLAEVRSAEKAGHATSVADMLNSLLKSDPNHEMLPAESKPKLAERLASCMPVTRQQSGGQGSEEEDTNEMLLQEYQTFVCSLAAQHMQHEPTAQWVMPAAVMFVDISGYSRVTQQLFEDGYSAYVLNDVVNNYLQRLVFCVNKRGGDIIKFAGDAMLVAWYNSKVPAENALAAAACAEELQEAGNNCEVLDTGMFFSVHIGIAHGSITSRIFTILPDDVTATHFHFVSGAPLVEVGIVCSAAAAGETALAESIVTLVEAGPHVKIEQRDARPSLLADVKVEDIDLSSAKSPPRQAIAGIDKFLPRAIQQRIASGIHRVFMAEMRKLTVLFIRYAGKTDEEVWFDEVYEILKRHNCSTIQVLDDDKGVHIVAAFNLYTMGHSACDSAISVAMALRESESNSIVGAASGEVFCGVVGADNAYQWDVTGVAVVRACRCMQHACGNGLTEVFDRSVINEARDKSNVQATAKPLFDKGSSIALDVFELTSSGTRKLSKGLDLYFTHTLCPNVHRDVVGQITNIISDRGSEDTPTTVVLNGPLGTGKFSVFLNCVNQTSFLPLVHLADEGMRTLQLSVLHTIGSWFSSSSSRPVQAAAGRVLEALHLYKHNHAFRLGLDLLQTVVRGGKYIALIVRRAQLLDQGSIAFLGTVSRVMNKSPRWITMLTCYPLYGFQHPERVLQAFQFSKSLAINRVNDADARALFEHCVDARCSNTLGQLVQRKSSGHVECIVEFATFLRKRNLLRTRNDGSVQLINSETVERVSWGEIAEILPRKTIHALDRLPPKLLVLTKIVCTITEQPGITAFFPAVDAASQRILGKKLNEGDIKNLEDLQVLRLCEHRCTAHVANGKLDAAEFFIPPMRDIVQVLQSPQQVADINQTCAKVYSETHPMNHPMQLLVRGRHHLFAGEQDMFLKNITQGWEMLCSRADSHDPKWRNPFIEWLGNLSSDQVAELKELTAAERRQVDKHRSRFELLQSLRGRGSRASWGLGSSSAAGSKSHSQAQKNSVRLASHSARDVNLAGVGSPLGASDRFGTENKLLQSQMFHVPLVVGPSREHHSLVVDAIMQLYDYQQSLKADTTESGPGDGDATNDKTTHEVPPFLAMQLAKCLWLYLSALERLRTTTKLDVPAVAKLRKLHEHMGKHRKSLSVDATLEMFAGTLADHIDDIRSMEAPLGDRMRSIDAASLPLECQLHFPVVCETLHTLSDEAEPVGQVLYALFEELPGILKLSTSATRRTAFCNALHDLHLASLGLPEALPAVRRSAASFFHLWLLEEVATS